ncbi:Uncharacterised protein [Clostridium tetanomorphum]|nr:Uncharacterised protein [Clostridium tetanomorphum]
MGINPIIISTIISRVKMVCGQSCKNKHDCLFLIHSATITPTMKASIGGIWISACLHSFFEAYMPKSTIFPVWALAKTPPLPMNV